MTIFLGGVHGVGKTFIAKPTCEKLGIKYATASNLIREERGLASWTTNKFVNEVEENQRALISAVGRVLQESRRLLLDGHFVLRRSPGVHERLQPSVFRALRCRHVILLKAPADVLLDRLSGRGDFSWTIEEVVSFSDAEVEHSHDVAHELGIPISVLETPNLSDFEESVRQI